MQSSPGGQIRSIAVGAALQAAGHNSSVTMDLVARAFENEMHKLNRLVMDSTSDEEPVELRG